MKIFIYKTAIITFIFVIIFEILIGSRINNLKKQIYELSSQQNREQIIIKIKDSIIPIANPTKRIKLSFGLICFSAILGSSRMV